LSGCVNLKKITCPSNNLTSADFLKQILNPKSLEEIIIYDNNIEPTNIEMFSRFINLKILKLGVRESTLKKGKRNKFYGSLKSYQNLTKLEAICIEATDVDSGLEYLPTSLVRASREEKKSWENVVGYQQRGGYAKIECSPHNTNAKCKAIQDQLRPYNYDIEAWQLTNPYLMKRVKSEIPSNERVQRINNKIEETKQELEQVKSENPDKDKKIERLESKIKLLEEELSFLAQENRELRTTIRELEQKVFILTQKLEQINSISQIEVKK
jgi:chromosome segregation ATPase